jgi:hypothetical protein
MLLLLWLRPVSASNLLIRCIVSYSCWLILSAWLSFLGFFAYSPVTNEVSLAASPPIKPLATDEMSEMSLFKYFLLWILPFFRLAVI